MGRGQVDQAAAKVIVRLVEEALDDDKGEHSAFTGLAPFIHQELGGAAARAENGPSLSSHPGRGAWSLRGSRLAISPRRSRRYLCDAGTEVGEAGLISGLDGRPSSELARMVAERPRRRPAIITAPAPV